MITPNALILTGCVCLPIATCAIVRVCVEWLDHIDEDRQSQKSRDMMLQDTMRSTERNGENLIKILVELQDIKATVTKIREELGIDIKKGLENERIR